MIRRLRFLYRCARGKPLYAQLWDGGRAGEDAVEELPLTYGKLESASRAFDDGE
jgi:hypothetical protein